MPTDYIAATTVAPATVISREVGEVGKNAGNKCRAGYVHGSAAWRVTRYLPNPLTAEPAEGMHGGCNLDIAGCQRAVCERDGCLDPTLRLK